MPLRQHLRWHAAATASPDWHLSLHQLSGCLACLTGAPRYQPAAASPLPAWLPAHPPPQPLQLQVNLHAALNFSVPRDSITSLTKDDAGFSVLLS